MFLHKGPLKCKEDIQRCVSCHLDDLPLVTFGSIDVLALLGRIDQLSKEVSALRALLKVKQMCMKTWGAVDQCVTELERTCGAAQGWEVQCIKHYCTRDHTGYSGKVYVFVVDKHNHSPQNGCDCERNLQLKSVSDNAMMQLKPNFDSFRFLVLILKPYEILWLRNWAGQ